MSQPVPSDDGRKRRGERARAAVLEQAVGIASIEGLEGLTFGRVATAAGIAKGNLQVLFGQKEAMQLATLDRAVDLYRTVVVKPALAQGSPLARLTALVDGWFAFVENRVLPGGCFLNAISSEYRTKPGVIRDRINICRAENRSQFRTLIQDARMAGELREDIDGEQLIFDLIACQAAANVAALMGDDAEFALARKTSQARIQAVLS